MIVEIIILSLVIGKVKKGKIKNLNQIYIRGWYLLIIAFLLEIISLRVFVNNFSSIQILIYIILIFILLLNINIKGMKTMAIGSILNFIPIIANNGRMPVSKSALIKAKLHSQLSLLENNKILTHVLADDSTRLYFLSDIIPILKPYPFPKVISIGDIVLSIGIFLLVQFYMKDINN
ncbi:MAG: DUF5317 domain-containing protein [Tissierellia bacterium]|nr:DUF5317 domain-containing protein [Tissierellia bacterium]